MIFQHLSPIELSLREKLLVRCADAAIRLAVVRGRSIYCCGDENKEIYFLERGRIRIGQVSPAGKEMIFELVRPGQLFGETALIAEGRRSEEARALEDSMYVSLPVSRVRQVLAGDSNLATNFLEFLSRRIVETRQRLADLAFNSNPRLVAKILLKEALQRGILNNGTIHLRLGLTHEQLGQLIGTSREIITAVLNDLRHLGLIDYERGSYTVFHENLQRHLDRLRYARSKCRREQ